MSDLLALSTLGLDEVDIIASGSVTISGTFVPVMQDGKVCRLELDGLKSLINT